MMLKEIVKEPALGARRLLLDTFRVPLRHRELSARPVLAALLGARYFLPI